MLNVSTIEQLQRRHEWGQLRRQLQVSLDGQLSLADSFLDGQGTSSQADHDLVLNGQGAVGGGVVSLEQVDRLQVQNWQGKTFQSPFQISLNWNSLTPGLLHSSVLLDHELVDRLQGACLRVDLGHAGLDLVESGVGFHGDFLYFEQLTN